MDRDVERFVENCPTCFRLTPKNNTMPMQRSVIPKEPWEKLAMDHYGPMKDHDDKHILVIVDYHSRYLIAEVVNSTDFASTRKVLDAQVELMGNMVSLRSDNARCFGAELTKWTSERGIKLEHSTPYDPQQNGMAEAAMKIMNKAMTAAAVEHGDYREELKRAVMAHNTAPHSVTGKPPEEALFKRRVRRALPTIRSENTMKSVDEMRETDAINKQKAKMRENAKRVQRPTEFRVGDWVVCKQLRKSNKHQPSYGEKMYKVTRADRNHIDIVSDDGQHFRKSCKHLKRVIGEEMTDEGEESEAAEEEGEQDQEVRGEEPELEEPAQNESAPVTAVRQSSRQRKQPSTLGDFLLYSLNDLLTRENRFGTITD